MDRSCRVKAVISIEEWHGRGWRRDLKKIHSLDRRKEEESGPLPDGRCCNIVVPPSISRCPTATAAESTAPSCLYTP